MKISITVLLVCTCLLTIPVTGIAGIFKYRNAEGTLTFVDDESKIPSQFLDNTESLPEAPTVLLTTPPRPELKPSVPPAPDREKAVEDFVEEQPEDHVTPVQILGNRVLIPVEVAMGNRVAKLSLLLDTGATTTVLHRESLADLDLPSGKKYKARVAGGGTVRSEKIRFRHISIGPFQQNKAYAMVINLSGKDLPFDGMLGMDFLKNHPYQIDFENEVITWEGID